MLEAVIIGGVTAPLAVLIAVVALVRMFRSIRVSLLDFCLMIWMVGLVVGLTAKFLPRDPNPIKDMLWVVAVGAVALYGGIASLHLIYRLEISSLPARALLVLQGVLLVPSGLLALASLFLAAEWALRPSGWVVTQEPWLLAPLAAGWLNAITFLRLVRRGENIWKTRTAAGAAGAVLPECEGAPDGSGGAGPPTGGSHDG